MKTVSTKEGLANALKCGETKILCTGSVAEAIRKKKNRKKTAIIGGVAAAVGSLIAIPFTAGASTPGVIAGMGLTVGALTISAAELALICGTTVAIVGLNKNYDVKFNPDGSVELTKK